MNKSFLSKTWPFFFITICVLLAYSNTFASPFVFDDLPYIEKIKECWPDSAWGYLSSSGNRVLSNLSIMLNYAVSGENVFSYHLVSILFHAGTCCFLYLLLREILQSDHFKLNESQKVYVPLAIVLIWGLHPLQTESVTYITQRAEVMIGFFTFAAFYFFIKGSRAEKRTPLFYSLSIVMFICGFFSKEAMIGAVLVVPLFDYCFIAGTWKRMFLKRWHFYGILFLFPALALIFNYNDIIDRAFLSLPEISPFGYFMTQCIVMLYYIYLSFYPVNLCFDYCMPFVGDLSLVYPYVISVFLILGISIYLFFKKPYIGFWMLFFFLNLAPRSSFAPRSDAMVEHRMYIPLLGLVVFSFILCFNLYKYLMNRYSESTTKVNSVFYPFLSLIIIALMVLTFSRNRVYESAFTLWYDTVQKASLNSRAHNNLGMEYHTRQEYEKAESAFRKALEIDPASAFAHHNLANVLATLKLYSEAEKHVRKAIEIKPGYITAHVILGSIFKDTGRLDDALEEYEKALALSPEDPTALTNIGSVYREKKQFAKAVSYYLKALSIAPEMTPASLNLGLIYTKTGKLEEAEVIYNNALRYDKYNPELYFRLGLISMQIENYDSAVLYFQRTILLDPEFPQVRENLAQANAKRGNTAKAIEFYKNLIKKNPDNFNAHSHLGLILLKEGQVDEAEKQFLKALELKPDMAEAIRNMGNIMVFRKEYLKAEEYYLMAMKETPMDPILYNNLGSVYAKQRKYREAIKAYKKAIEIKPDYLEAKENLKTVVKNSNK